MIFLFGGFPTSFHTHNSSQGWSHYFHATNRACILSFRCTIRGMGSDALRSDLAESQLTHHCFFGERSCVHRVRPTNLIGPTPTQTNTHNRQMDRRSRRARHGRPLLALMLLLLHLALLASSSDGQAGGSDTWAVLVRPPRPPAQWLLN